MIMEGGISSRFVLEKQIRSPGDAFLSLTNSLVSWPDNIPVSTFCSSPCTLPNYELRARFIGWIEHIAVKLLIISLFTRVQWH
jgi:hypothetical protein